MKVITPNNYAVFDYDRIIPQISPIFINERWELFRCLMEDDGIELSMYEYRIINGLAPFCFYLFKVINDNTRLMCGMFTFREGKYIVEDFAFDVKEFTLGDLECPSFMQELSLCP